MGIYINGMEMPKEGSWKTVRIYPDGTCAVPNWQGDCTLIKGAQAVSVPPHGDLIERKTAYDSLLNGMVMTGYQSRALDCINEFYVPTIISASESKEYPAFLPQYELTPRSEEGET